MNNNLGFYLCCPMLDRNHRLDHLFILALLHPLLTWAEVCVPPTQLQLDQKQEALFSAFEKGRYQLDLIILIDRSRSVNNATNLEMMAGVSALIDGLVSSTRLYIHPDLGRIALLSYGTTITAEFEGISSADRTFDACQVDTRISSLRTQTTQETNTNVWQALQKAAQIFSARRAELQLDQSAAQTPHRQVLWTFYDGDANQEDEEDTELVKQVAGELVGAGVVLFSAAIGHTPAGWLDTPEEENRVRELAKDSDHFACVDSWIDLLEQLQPETDVSDDPVYAAVDPETSVTPPQCVTCPLTCACDVIQREYSCVSCAVVGRCDNVTTSPRVPQQTSGDRGLLRETWFVVVLAVVVSVTFFLVCITLVGLVCCCRDRPKKSPEAPPLPLPPRKYHQRSLHIMSEPVYSNTSPRPASGGMGEEPNWAEEEVEMGRQSEQTVEEYHRNMPDWDHFLYTEAERSSLKHLAVYSLHHDASAWTPGFILPTPNIKTISKALSRKSLYKKPTLKVGNKTFIVDKASVTPTKISGQSLNTGSDPECVHICKVGKFLVVGVATTDKIDVCQSKVAEICEHLEAEPALEHLPEGGVSIEGGVVNKGILQETL